MRFIKLVIMYILSLCTISQLFTNSPFPTLLILLYCQLFVYILYFIYHYMIFESFWSLKSLVGQSFMRIYFRYGFDLAFTPYVFRVQKINATIVNVSQ